MFMFLAILEGVSVGLLVPTLIWAVSQIKGHRRKHELLEKANRAQLRHNLVASCSKAIKDEEVELYELESINDQFDIYIEMGGNGLVHCLIEKVRKLKIKGGTE